MVVHGEPHPRLTAGIDSHFLCNPEKNVMIEAEMKSDDVES